MRPEQRWRMFLAAIGVLAATSIVLAAINGGATKPVETPDAPAKTVEPSGTQLRSATPTPTPIPSPTPPPTPTPRPTNPKVIRAARAVALRFLHGYLPYAYGGAHAGRIEAATPRLLQGLEAHSPRPALGLRNRVPRVATIYVRTEGDGVVVDAEIRDTVRRYVITLEMVRRGNGYLVAAVS